MSGSQVCSVLSLFSRTGGAGLNVVDLNALAGQLNGAGGGAANAGGNAPG